MAALSGKRVLNHRLSAANSRLLIGTGLALIAAGMWLRILARSSDEPQAMTPQEAAYSAFIAAELDTLGMELTETGWLLQQPKMESVAWRTNLERDASAVTASANRIQSRRGTGRFEETDRGIQPAMAKYVQAMALVKHGLDTRDTSCIARALAQTREAGELLSRAEAPPR